jgi:hypothetical protein
MQLFLGGWIAQNIFVAKRLAQGFVVAALALGVSNVAALLVTGNVRLGLLYFLVLVIPLSATAFLLARNRRKGVQNGVANYKLAGILFALQGGALACWSFDNATTFYAIDVVRVATELNPLGWPLGALGALVYYGPTLILTYVLLFRIGQKSALYAAIGITIVTLYMGLFNLNAGAINFKIFLTFAPPSMPITLQNSLLTTMATVDLIYVTILATIARKQNLNRQRRLDTLKNL